MANKLTPAPEAHFTTAPTEGGCRITGYTGPGGDVVIPQYFGGCCLHHIGTHAFKGCTSITTVTFPEFCRTIQEEAFAG